MEPPPPPPPPKGLDSSVSSTTGSSGDDPHTELTKCLFSQYGFTFASVSLATAYSLYRRPKNGMSIMLMTGATGTIVDFLYSYMVTCSNEVMKSNEYYVQQKRLELQQQQQPPPPHHQQQQQQQQKEEERNNDTPR